MAQNSNVTACTLLETNWGLEVPNSKSKKEEEERVGTNESVTLRDTELP